MILAKYKPKVVAITGSVGKTSTKDAVYAVLSKVAYVRKSAKNFNSDLGLPLTVLGCPSGGNSLLIWTENILKGLWMIIYPHKYPKWLVLEVGIRKPGDMAHMAEWLKSDVVIMTMIGDMPTHIEFFHSRKQLIEEKSALIKTLKKDGLLILNADDHDVLHMKSRTKCRTLTYGFDEGADMLGSGVDIFYNTKGEPEGVSYRVDEGGKSLPVFIDGAFGINYVYATLGAFAFASGVKISMLEAINAVKKYDMSPGRMRLLGGLNDTLIIDDTYNSSPFACRSALKTLGEVKANGKKIAVLGDMLELGKHTIEAHTEIGKHVKGNADILVVVGLRSKSIKEGAIEAGMDADKIFEFLNAREAGEYVKILLKKGDIVLVKGSQAMRMERVVEAILFDQEHKRKLLARQDKEWLDRP